MLGDEDGWFSLFLLENVLKLHVLTKWFCQTLFTKRGEICPTRYSRRLKRKSDDILLWDISSIFSSQVSFWCLYSFTLSWYDLHNHLCFFLCHTTVRAVFVSTSRENSKRDIWITENERGYIVFGVRSCKQARLFLNEGIGKLGKAYTIVLGAKQNRISKIIKGEQVLVQVDTPDLVDCDETKYFWISWLNGVIEVGRGMRLRDRLFMSTPPGTDTSNLTALTIDSRYDNAHWQFRSIEGMCHFRWKISNIKVFDDPVLSSTKNAG